MKFRGRLQERIQNDPIDLGSIKKESLAQAETVEFLICQIICPLILLPRDPRKIQALLPFSQGFRQLHEQQRQGKLCGHQLGNRIRVPLVVRSTSKIARTPARLIHPGTPKFDADQRAQ